ncbi:MAG: lysophospholipase [Anaerolineae bacterium]|nr:lysophospholipase [Anaerolineae bacterium]
MRHETGTLVAGDGVALFTQQWLPEGAPVAGVLLVHGVAEHSGRYQHVAEFLTGRAYGVYTLDLRGHGKSPGLRAYVDSYTLYLDDLKSYLDAIRADQPGLPIFILGHSMGGLIALAFTARYQDQLAGMITSGAPVNLAETTAPALVLVARVLDRVLPKAKLVALDAADMSHDPAIRESYDTDPLNYRGKLTVRQGMVLTRLAEAAQAGLPGIRIPCLCMHGAQDVVADPTALDMIEGHLGAPDRTFKRYAGMFHEIFNELEKQTVLEDVGRWLDARRTPAE